MIVFKVADFASSVLLGRVVQSILLLDNNLLKTLHFSVNSLNNLINIGSLILYCSNIVRLISEILATSYTLTPVHGLVFEGTNLIINAFIL